MSMILMTTLIQLSSQNIMDNLRENPGIFNDLNMRSLSFFYLGLPNVKIHTWFTKTNKTLNMLQY